MMVLAGAALLVVPTAPAVAQNAEDDSSVAAQSGGLSGWIAENNVHRIAGYTSLGLMAGTATAGMLAGADVEAARAVHPYLGLATAASAASSSALGTLAYNDRLGIVWPHAALNGLAVTGLLLNAFGVFEYGGVAHRTTGILSAASMAGAYLSIVLILR